MGHFQCSVCSSVFLIVNAKVHAISRKNQFIRPRFRVIFIGRQLTTTYRYIKSVEHGKYFLLSSLDALKNESLYSIFQMDWYRMAIYVARNP